MWDGSKPAAEATDLRRLSNLPYVNGMRPLLEGAGKTKAGPDSGAGTSLKACCSAEKGHNGWPGMRGSGTVRRR